MRRVLAVLGLAAVTMPLLPVRANADIDLSGVLGQRAADLSVAVSGAPRQARSGYLIPYVVRLRNNGPVAAADISLTTRLSPGLAVLEVSGARCAEQGSLISCGPARLASGSATAIHILGIVKPSATGTIKVTAHAGSAGVTDPNPGDNAAVATTAVRPSSDLEVRLTAPPAARPGERLTLDAAVRNRGPRAARQVTLHLGTTRRARYVESAGTPCHVAGAGQGRRFIRCALGSVAAGERRTVRVAVRMTTAIQASAAASMASFAASVSANIGDSHPSNNVAMARVRYAPARLASQAFERKPAVAPRVLPVTGPGTYDTGPLFTLALGLIALGVCLIYRVSRPVSSGRGDGR